MVVAQFLEADKDGSGALDAEEVAWVLRQMYRKERTARKLELIQAEVEATMKEYDRDGSGVLEFNEFVAFICSGENKLKLSPEQKDRIMNLAKIMNFKMAKDPGSPVSRRAEWLRRQDEGEGSDLDIDLGVPVAGACDVADGGA